MVGTRKVYGWQEGNGDQMRARWIREVDESKGGVGEV